MCASLTARAVAACISVGVAAASILLLAPARLYMNGGATQRRAIGYSVLTACMLMHLCVTSPLAAVDIQRVYTLAHGEDFLTIARCGRPYPFATADRAQPPPSVYALRLCFVWC